MARIKEGCQGRQRGMEGGIVARREYPLERIGSYQMDVMILSSVVRRVMVSVVRRVMVSVIVVAHGWATAGIGTGRVILCDGAAFVHKVWRVDQSDIYL